MLTHIKRLHMGHYCLKAVSKAAMMNLVVMRNCRSIPQPARKVASARRASSMSNQGSLKPGGAQGSITDVVVSYDIPLAQDVKDVRYIAKRLLVNSFTYFAHFFVHKCVP